MFLSDDGLTVLPEHLSGIAPLPGGGCGTVAAQGGAV